jgi:hypothetical protein
VKISAPPLGSRHIETSMKGPVTLNVDDAHLDKLPCQKSINLARKKCTDHTSKTTILSQQLDIHFPLFYTKESLNSILIIFVLDMSKIVGLVFEIDCRTPE